MLTLSPAQLDQIEAINASLAADVWYDEVAESAAEAGVCLSCLGFISDADPDATECLCGRCVVSEHDYFNYLEIIRS